MNKPKPEPKPEPEESEASEVKEDPEVNDEPLNITIEAVSENGSKE